MKNRSLSLFVILAVLLITAPAMANPSTYFETFDNNKGGFHYGYGTHYTDGNVTWEPSGGNPAGHIHGKADKLYAAWVYKQDINGGEFGNMTGQTLSIDTKISGNTTGKAQFYVGRDGTYYIANSTWDISADQDWTTHTIVLEDSNLTEWWGANIDRPLSYVLEEPDDIGIFFGGLLADGNGDLDIDNFGIPQDQTLDVNKNGSGTVTSSPGGIDCGTDCSEAYPYNTSVTLTATPDAGSVFVGWSGDCNATGHLNMDADKNCTAEFKLIDQTLTVNKSGSGSGTVTSSPGGIDCGTDCSEAYPYNTSVTLTATPDAGSVFIGWSGDCNATGHLNMDADKNCTAEFKLVDDGDGVAAGIEDQAPNNGDGNDDGIPDSIQGSVTSLPAASGAGYVTVETTGGCNQNLEVKTLTPSPADPDYNYPFGLVSFKLNCPSAKIRIYFHESSDLQGFTYRKYGPTPPGFTAPTWYTLPGTSFGTKNIGGQTVAYAEFTLTDGGLGDDTGLDGVIVDRGGPGTPTPIPTLNEWGIILLTLFAGLIAIRQRHRRSI